MVLGGFVRDSGGALKLLGFPCLVVIVWLTPSGKQVLKRRLVLMEYREALFRQNLTLSHRRSAGGALSAKDTLSNRETTYISPSKTPNLRKARKSFSPFGNPTGGAPSLRKLSTRLVHGYIPLI